MDTLLNTRQISERLLVCLETTRRMCRANKLPGLIRIGAGYRITEANLQRFLEQNRVNSRKEAK